MGASLTSLLLWFHSRSLILLLQASLSHLSSSCVTLSSSAEFKYVCAIASGRVHVPECMYVRVCERNEVCLTCACHRQLSGLWMLDGGFYDLVKTGYIIQSSIHSEREKAKKKDRLRGRERERKIEAAGWVKFNEFSHGRWKNDCESWQRRKVSTPLISPVSSALLFFWLIMGDVLRKKKESEMSRVSFSSRCVTLLPHVAFLTLLSQKQKCLSCTDHDCFLTIV